MQLGSGIKYGIQAIGHAMGAGKNGHQVGGCNAFRPPGLHLLRKQVQVTAVGYQCDALAWNTTVGDALHDAGRESHQCVRRTVAGKFQHTHGPQDGRVADHAHGTWQLRPEVAHLKHEWLATQPARHDAGDAGRQGRGGGKGQIVLFAQGQHDATGGEFQEGHGAAYKAVMVGVGQIQLDDINAVHDATSHAVGVGATQAGIAAGKAAAHHGDLVAALDQAACHGIGTDGTCTVRGDEVLVEI